MFGIGKGAGKVVNDALGVADKLVTDKDKKQDIASDIVQSELSSGSAFVRNARPMIIYTGLFVIICEMFGLRLLILSNIEGENIIKSSNAILEYFLFTWGGITTVYIGGRSYEKAKMRFMRRSKRD
jgi:hypothetical protein